MRIHVQSLPFNQDFSTDFEIPESTFEADMSKHGEAEVHFLEPVHCHATLRKMAGDEIFLQISADTTLEPICDRCTEPYRYSFDLETSLLCKPLTHKPTEDEVEDEGLMYFTKQELHLDDIVREQILLNLPIQYVCNENCKGLCPGCGENLNKSPTEDHPCDKGKFFEYKAKVL